MGQAGRQAEGQRQSKTEGEVNRGYLQAWRSLLVQVHVEGRARCGSPRNRAMTRWRGRWRLRIVPLWPKAKSGFARRSRFRLWRSFARSALSRGLSPVTAQKTWRDFYRVGLMAIKDIRRSQVCALTRSPASESADFASYRQAQGPESELQSTLHCEFCAGCCELLEWGELERHPRSDACRVSVTGSEYDTRKRKRDILLARPLLAEIATVLVDTGFAPRSATGSCGSRSLGSTVATARCW